MTVITPYQRQLIFTRSLSDRPTSYRSTGWVSFQGPDWQGLIEEGLITKFLAFSLTLGFVGLLFFGIDAVLVSFKIKTISAALEQGRIQRESLEIRKAQLLSLEALKDYASMIQLTQAQRISYLVGGQANLAQAYPVETTKTSSAQ